MKQKLFPQLNKYYDVKDGQNNCFHRQDYISIYHDLLVYGRFINLDNCENENN
jgi:hypothetical protein